MDEVVINNFSSDDNIVFLLSGDGSRTEGMATAMLIKLPSLSVLSTMSRPTDNVDLATTARSSAIAPC